MNEIYSKYFSKYVSSPTRKLPLEKKHFKAVYQSLACRTPKLGYASFMCEGCSKYKFIYRSCTNRFCSQCGAHSTFKWAEESLSRLLDIKHHHIVMTLPKPLRFLSKMNGNKIHDLLFTSAAKVISEWFEAKHNLKPGIVSVLHTAGSDLKYHPHVHMIVTGGGRHLKTNKIVQLKSDYLTRQRFFGQKLKKEFSSKLVELIIKGELIIPNKWKNQPNLFKKWIRDLGEKHWIVSIQKPLDDLNQIVGYVGRYTKRASISEYKICDINNGKIKFKFNDYKNTPRGEKAKIAYKEMDSDEFLDSLLQHVPDNRYRMVRYYGLYCSHYLGSLPKKSIEPKPDHSNPDMWGEFQELRKLDLKNGNPDQLICPDCKIKYTFVGIVFPNQHKIDDS